MFDVLEIEFEVDVVSVVFVVSVVSVLIEVVNLVVLCVVELCIVGLQVEFVEVCYFKFFDLYECIQCWVDEVGFGFGWVIVYFVLVLVWWNGQIIGKCLFGLCIVEFIGKLMMVMCVFKCYGGYVVGLVIGLFGFVQVFWDLNCQVIQDKIVYMVVIDLCCKLVCFEFIILFEEL